MRNISKSKDNQTMTFGHSIEWEIFFVKNVTQNVVEKVFLDPPLKNQNWTYQYSKASYSLFLLCAKFRAKLQTTCFYLIYGFFFKKKRGLGLVSLPHFLHDFWRKIFFLLHSINWPNFVIRLPVLRKILGNMFIVIAC